MENIKVIGNGAWGTALQTLITQNRASVSLTTFILAIPTNSLRDVLNKIRDQVNNNTLIIINCSKGIEVKTHKLPFQITRDILGENINYFSLIGPSFANEVIEKNPTVVNLGYFNKKYLKQVRTIFQTDYFEVVPTDSLEAIELMGAFKNIYAIACGISEGMGFGANTRARLIVLAYKELYRLLKSLNYKYENTAQIALIGDLILTCNSSQSRNFRCGKLLTQKSAKDSLDDIKQTAEGVLSSQSVPYFEGKAKIKLPLAKLVYKIINKDKPSFTKKQFIEFLGR